MTSAEKTTSTSHLIGWTGTRTARHAVYVEVELREGRPLPRLRPDAFAEGFDPYDNPERGVEASFTYTAADSCGANVPGAVAEVIAAVEAGEGSYADGWDTARLRQLAEVADEWHLATHAGCRHQREAGWTVPSEYRDPRATDRALGTACPECGYRFGHGWAYAPMPPDVVEFVRALVESEGDEVVSPMEEFARRHGIEAEVEQTIERDDGSRGFRVTLRRGNETMVVPTYTMGSALEGEPTVEYVLNAIAVDLGWIDSGEETDAATWRAIEREREDAQRFLGDERLAELLDTPTL